jgi:hypothetical protein
VPDVLSALPSSVTPIVLFGLKLLPLSVTVLSTAPALGLRPARLEERLRRAAEISRELEAANEQLSMANAELRSANEEFQVTAACGRGSREEFLVRPGTSAR